MGSTGQSFVVHAGIEHHLFDLLGFCLTELGRVLRPGEATQLPLKGIRPAVVAGGGGKKIASCRVQPVIDIRDALGTVLFR